MRTEPRTLEALRNRRTAYEVVVDLPTGRGIRLGFSIHKSRTTLFRFAREHRDLLLPHIPADATWSYDAKAGRLDLGGVAVRFSGLTERECALWDGYEIAEAEGDPEDHDPRSTPASEAPMYDPYPFREGA